MHVIPIYIKIYPNVFSLVYHDMTIHVWI